MHFSVDRKPTPQMLATTDDVADEEKKGASCFREHACLRFPETTLRSDHPGT